MYRVKLAPDVEGKMLNNNFWSKELKSKELLSAVKIKEFNQKIYNKAEKENKEQYYCNLKKFVQNLNENNLSKMIKNTYSRKIKADQNYFNLQGKLISTDQRESIKNNCDLASIEAKKNISIKYGILCRRANIRALPAETTFASEKESGDQDLLQLTALSCGSAVVILAESRDQKWYYIQAKLMQGWVKKNNIALTDSLESAQSYLNTDSFLIVSGSRIETEPTPFEPETANRFFQMGDKIPLVEQEAVLENIPENHPHAQSSLGNYLVWLPSKDRDNKLKYKKAVIAGSNDVQAGYLKLNRENIINQAFKMLGDRYDWGGKYQRRDCSRFIMDIYRAFGIELPRNADLQELLSPFENHIFSGALEKRKAILNKLEAGDIIHMPGHIMLYLGKDQNKNFLVHAASGYGEIDKSGKIKAKSIRSVFIMELEQLLQDGKNTYLKKISSASKIK
jgi:cell wall-associated NlpC family hydrolase